MAVVRSGYANAGKRKESREQHTTGVGRRAVMSGSTPLGEVVMSRTTGKGLRRVLALEQMPASRGGSGAGARAIGVRHRRLLQPRRGALAVRLARHESGQTDPCGVAHITSVHTDSRCGTSVVTDGEYGARSNHPAGSNSSIGFPSGSANWICLPPGPTSISLRKCNPAARIASIRAGRSITRSTTRFHPPGSCARPSGIVRDPDAPGPLSNSVRVPRETLPNAGSC